MMNDVDVIRAGKMWPQGQLKLIYATRSDRDTLSARVNRNDRITTVERGWLLAFRIPDSPPSVHLVGYSFGASIITGQLRSLDGQLVMTDDPERVFGVIDWMHNVKVPTALVSGLIRIGGVASDFPD